MKRVKNLLLELAQLVEVGETDPRGALQRAIKSDPESRHYGASSSDALRAFVDVLRRGEFDPADANDARLLRQFEHHPMMKAALAKLGRAVTATIMNAVKYDLSEKALAKAFGFGAVDRSTWDDGTPNVWVMKKILGPFEAFIPHSNATIVQLRPKDDIRFAVRGVDTDGPVSNEQIDEVVQPIYERGLAALNQVHGGGWLPIAVHPDSATTLDGHPRVWQRFLVPNHRELRVYVRFVYQHPVTSAFLLKLIGG